MLIKDVLRLLLIKICYIELPDLGTIYIYMSEIFDEHLDYE